MDYVFVSVVGLVCTLVIARLIQRLYIKWDQARIAIESAKERRAQVYAQAAEGMLAHLRERNALDRETANMFAANFATANKALNRLDNSLRALQAKIDGKISFEDSLSAIKVLLCGEVAYEAGTVIETALRENDYEARKAFVASKFSKRVNEVFALALDRISPLPLSVDPSRYLTDRAAQALWGSVEDYFLHESDLEVRVEEARMAIKETLQSIYETTTQTLRRELGAVSDHLEAVRT